MSTLKEQLDYFTEFKPWYEQIARDMRYDPRDDRKSRDLLSTFLSKKPEGWNLEPILESFSRSLQDKPNIFIYGCGPSLEPTLNDLINSSNEQDIQDLVHITADGASRPLSEKGIPIHSIFTDLDGITKKLFSQPKFTVVHAHGDNMETLRDFKSNIIKFENVVGTTQVEPLHNVINPGGFTDGDRILYFLRSILSPNQTAYMIGMDFGTEVGRYSKPRLTEDEAAGRMKEKKLGHAVQLVEWIIPKMRARVKFVNGQESSDFFTYLSFEEFLSEVGLN